jgi:hypothetical protein
LIVSTYWTSCKRRFRVLLKSISLVERASPIIGSSAPTGRAGEEVKTDGSPHRARDAPRVDREGQLATSHRGRPLCGGRPFASGCRSESGRVTGDEAVGGDRRQMPARSRPLFGADGVESQPGDLDEGVAGVGVDRDPPAGPRRAPAHQVAGGERLRDQAAAEEGEADRAGAVVGVAVEGGVAAAPYIRAPDDRVGGVDCALDRFGGIGGREGDAGEEDRGRVGAAAAVGEDLHPAEPGRAVGDVGSVAAGRGGRQERRVGGDFRGARQVSLLRRFLPLGRGRGFDPMTSFDHREAVAQRAHRLAAAAGAEKRDRHLEDCRRRTHTRCKITQAWRLVFGGRRA